MRESRGAHPGERGALGRLVVRRNGRLGRDHEKNYLVVAEAKPDPEVPTSNSAHPGPAYRTFSGLEVGWAWKVCGVRESPHRSRDGASALRACNHDRPDLPSVPSRYASASRHESSPLPSSHLRNASDSSGERSSPRSAPAIASPRSDSSSGCGFHCDPECPCARSGLTLRNVAVVQLDVQKRDTSSARRSTRASVTPGSSSSAASPTFGTGSTTCRCGDLRPKSAAAAPHRTPPVPAPVANAAAISTPLKALPSGCRDPADKDGTGRDQRDRRGTETRS